MAESKLWRCKLNETVFKLSIRCLQTLNTQKERNANSTASNISSCEQFHEQSFNGITCSMCILFYRYNENQSLSFPLSNLQITPKKQRSKQQTDNYHTGGDGSNSKTAEDRPVAGTNIGRNCLQNWYIVTRRVLLSRPCKWFKGWRVR